MDTESPSERRRRLIPLLNGRSIATGIYGDLDRFQLGGILDYKTLVLPRSPVASRPSSPYQLVWSGRYYTVWQRPATFPAVAEHLPLGNALQPGAVPRCSEVLSLARRVGSGGRIAAAVRRPVVVVNLSSATHPSRWAADGDGLLYPKSEDDVRTTVKVGRTGTYEVWLGGSFRDRLRLAVDGKQLADRRYRLNGSGDWTPLGRISLARGSHPVTLRVGGSGLLPGSGGYPFGMGPLVLSRTTAADAAIKSVPASDARSLCGKRLDWVEGRPS